MKGSALFTCRLVLRDLLGWKVTSLQRGLSCLRVFLVFLLLYISVIYLFIFCLSSFNNNNLGINEVLDPILIHCPLSSPSSSSSSSSVHHLTGVFFFRLPSALQWLQGRSSRAHLQPTPSPHFFPLSHWLLICQPPVHEGLSFSKLLLVPTMRALFTGNFQIIPLKWKNLPDFLQYFPSHGEVKLTAVWQVF